jgi:deoxyadenosine/deoxycytidine kinase
MSRRLWLIVEGPDGAGKSTLAQQAAHMLASDGGGRPERPCFLQKLSYDSMRKDYVLPRMHTHLHVVQDRGPTSGLVYEPLMRGDKERLSWFDPLTDQVIEEGAAMIHVTAALPTLEDRLTNRGDDYVQPALLKDFLEGYEREVARWEDKGGIVETIDTTWAFPSATELALVLSLLRVKVEAG